ncbi:MAG TPA: FAD-dependent oxidoreductase, partial [Bacillota bacterium]|nr:FAD-dependent oxidoreductase [Bacillota bacterium]
GGEVTGVQLSTGETIAAQVVIVGKGVKPNLELAQGAGIATERGILVNELMETSSKGVFAAGDVAQAVDIVSGQPKINAIWPNAAEQGKVAGRNMAGANTAYEGSLAMNSADFFGLSVIAAGKTRVAAGEAGFEVTRFNAGTDSYRALIFQEDKLAGYILVGDTAKAGLLTALIREGMPLGKVREQLRQGIIRPRLLW